MGWLLQLLMQEAMKDAGGKNSAGGSALGALAGNKFSGSGSGGNSILSKQGTFDPYDTEYTRKRSELLSKGMSY